jgi:response regulator RpfG family c-di-GMP phosphodiesterase
MLTSKADLESAIQVVNQANIFRFLTKPCDTDVMVKCLRDALQQYRLVMTEREVLEKTLRGSIRVMTEILSMVDPQSFDRAVALQDNVRTLATALGVDNVWQLEVAAMLAQIGCVTMPLNVINKAREGVRLREAEQSMFERVPQIGRNLLGNIPRLEAVAEIVFYQDKNFDGSGFPPDKIAGESIPLGARILKVLIDLAELKGSGTSLDKALQIMRQREGSYDPRILETAFSCFVQTPQVAQPIAKYSFPVKVDELRLAQVLLANVETLDGTLLVPAGREITETILEKISNFAALSGIKEPILIESVTPKETPE